ncbi:MAG: sigma-70 family RNA polymerase sigma factor [Acidimicrobiia bacterium]|nr:sigma-70 family RNA polymerase sigma factor [Acidimicrobiia bacterium]
MGDARSQHSDFEAMYSEYRLPVLAYCTRRIGPPDANDACAETFLIAWRRRTDLPQPPGTLPYLYGIAGKVIANQRRGLARRTRLETKIKGLGTSPMADPETVAVRREQDRIVEKAVKRLRPKDREIVMLYAWEELPRESIAELMGMTKTAVDQRIHRAYKRLARTLEPITRTRQSPLTVEEGGT